MCFPDVYAILCSPGKVALRSSGSACHYNNTRNVISILGYGGNLRSMPNPDRAWKRPRGPRGSGRQAGSRRSATSSRCRWTPCPDVPAAVGLAGIPAADVVRCAGVDVPTVMLAIPFTVLTVFTINVLLVEIGAADFSGTGAALGAVTQIGPIVTVLVIAGQAPPRCAPTSARGPSVRRSTRSRCWASTRSRRWWFHGCSAATLVSLMLTSVVTMVGIIGGFVFSVYFQHVTPGAFAAGLTLLVGPRSHHQPGQGRDIRVSREPDRLLQGTFGRGRAPGRR